MARIGILDCPSPGPGTTKKPLNLPSLQDSTACEQNSDDGDDEDLPEDENSDVDLDSQENKHSSEQEGSISDMF
jgi:hypothetical protein